MIEKLQHRYALSERGAKDLVQGVIACTVQNIAFMFPVSLLYFFVGDLLDGGIHGSRIAFYVVGVFVLPGSDLRDHILAVQHHIPGNLCGDGNAAYHFGRKASEDSIILFREERSGRSDKYHHGGLYGFRNSVFPFYSAVCRFADLDGAHCCKPVLF